MVEFAASPIVKLAQTRLESLEGFGFRDLGRRWGLSFLLASPNQGKLNATVKR